MRPSSGSTCAGSRQPRHQCRLRYHQHQRLTAVRVRARVRVWVLPVRARAQVQVLVLELGWWARVWAAATAAPRPNEQRQA
jgi:hypothetical protein